MSNSSCLINAIVESCSIEIIRVLPGASFVQTKPTVVVQPTVVPSYPMYVYKETPWMSQETKAQYRQTNNYKPPLKYMTQWSSPCRKKLLKNDQEICRTPPVRTSYNESYHDFSPDLPLELSNLYDKENLDNYGTNYEVESPSRNDIKPVCHRQHLSEFSINSIFGYYNDLDRQTPNNTMKRLKSVQYTDNTIAHDGISDEIDSNYSPDIYNKTRNYSKF
ncbi:hypothetical protein PCANB_001343 [Pneumocystis canis]|nr:hypothetical protein PCANB_001343 [Pneumocystis canis]